jgi:hypothetical protein
MTREQLEHAIRAAGDVAEDTELVIFGSQAILGQFPDAPDTLRASIEVDLQPKNRPEAADLVDAMLGENSQFHRTHGFYVHGLQIDEAAFPEGWQERAVAVSDPQRTRGHTGWCVEAHDLAANKLRAYREKDREFVRTLLAEDLIDAEQLLERLERVSCPSDTRERLKAWVRTTAGELA